MNGVDSGRGSEKPSQKGTSTVVIDPTEGHCGVTFSHYHGKGVRIQFCHPADLLAKSGISAGDVVIAMNSMPVDDHATAIKLICSFVEKFTVDYFPSAKAALIQPVSMLEKVKAAVPWAVVSALPTLIMVLYMVRSVDTATKLTPIFGVISVGAAAACIHVGKHNSRLGVHGIGRGLATFSAICFLTAIVNSLQEIRRCITNLCAEATMYGSRWDCLWPCSTPYAKWHKVVLHEYFTLIRTRTPLPCTCTRTHNRLTNTHTPSLLLTRSLTSMPTLSLIPHPFLIRKPLEPLSPLRWA